MSIYKSCWALQNMKVKVCLKVIGWEHTSSARGVPSFSNWRHAACAAMRNTPSEYRIIIALNLRVSFMAKSILNNYWCQPVQMVGKCKLQSMEDLSRGPQLVTQGPHWSGWSPYPTCSMFWRNMFKGWNTKEAASSIIWVKYKQVH